MRTPRAGATKGWRAAAIVAAVLAMSAAGGGCATSASTSAPAASRATPVAAIGSIPATEVVHTIGFSVRHRPIRVHVIGDPSASRSILVVGCVHGDESAGEQVTRRLRSGTPPANTRWWIVHELNPDGCDPGTRSRQNAHGVDLNRNSPWHWRPIGRPGSTYYSGTGPLSEPESRAINRLIGRVRPAVSVWYHQHAALVDSSSGGSSTIERRYAKTAKLPLTDYGVFPGSITTWQDHRYPSDTAFCVELPAGALPAAAVRRHVKAVEGL